MAAQKQHGFFVKRSEARGSGRHGHCWRPTFSTVTIQTAFDLPTPWCVSMNQNNKLSTTRSLIAVLIALVLSACGQSSSPSNPKVESPASLQQKAEAGDAAAQLALGQSLVAVEKPDSVAAFGWYLKAAEGGNPEAMFRVYMAYRDGDGTRRDVDAASKWLNRAVALDYPAALGEKARGYGVCIRGKVDVSGNSPDERERNILEMVRLYEKAAVKGDHQSQVVLGSCYLFGITEGTKSVIRQDHDKALPLLKIGAEKGNALSQWMLGVTYQFGFGETMADTEQAKIWWDKLEQQKDSFEQRWIANIYLVDDQKDYVTGKNKWRDRKLTFDESNQIAVDWLDKAAVQGDTKALITLSSLYQSGKVFRKDLARAFEYQLKAAEGGDPSAQLEVATDYYYGRGVAKNFSASVKWLERVVNNTSASAREIAWAQGMLGEVYSQGIGVQENFVVAYAWTNLALANGLNDADVIKLFETQRRTIEKKLTGDQLNEAQQLSANWKQGQPMQVVAAQESSQSETSSAKRDVPSSSLKKASAGSAIVISSQGKLLTNHHVVNECKEIRIPVANKNAVLVVADKANDLALLQVEGEVALPGTVPAVFADENSVKQGEDIVTFGFPLDGFLPASGNITQGIISALAGPFNNSSVLQITAPVQLGNSGGPVLNMKGQVVGVVIGKADAVKLTKATGDIPQNINFAISGRVAKGFFEGNSITYEKPGAFALSKDTAALADLSKKTTVKVECWK